MSLKLRLLNRLCQLAYRKEYRRFLAIGHGGPSLHAVQHDKLMQYLKTNADTEYGRKYDFASIHSYEEYAERVPLTVYEDYEDMIRRIGEGEEKILTAEPVKLFELTSGSSGGKKWIPYTATLKAEFQYGIYPWLYDLYHHVDGLYDGTSYWSITPVTTKRSYSSCGIPIGFEEDTEYFGKFVAWLMNRIFAVDSAKVKFVSDMEEFYHRTSCGMLKGRKLSLISVWNPTFLSLLCNYIGDHAKELEEECGLRKGELQDAVAKNDFSKAFPKLRLVSCWADGSAAEQVKDLEQRFPGVIIEPKGILATECFLSFPFLGEEGSRLSAYSHFFEFRSLTDGRICMADSLKPGDYEVILTTGGGFYRYCIGDVIHVISADGMTPPRVRFLHRAGATCDLCGEKLSNDFVQTVCQKLQLQNDFCLLTPEGQGYVLYTNNRSVSGAAFDAALRESFHYNYCRELGQLDEVRVVQTGGNEPQIYMDRMMAEGMRMGDIKPALLSRLSGWAEWFDGSRTLEETKND